MKKLITLILALVMIFTVTCAMAEELTFQGVPWLSNKTEAIKHLKDAGFISGSEPELQEHNKKGEVFYSHVGVYKKDKKVPYRYVFKEADACATCLLNQTIWADNIPTTIAKQTIRNVSLLYSAGVDSPQLVEVCIWFDNQDADYDMKAVYAALEAAYGKPKASRKDKEFIWLGDKNTIVILYNNDVVFATLDGLAPKTAETKKDTGF